MITRNLFLPLLVVSLFSASVCMSQVKWVDEKGRVHFGDRLPDGYEGQAEEVELKPAPSLGATEEEIKKMERERKEAERRRKREEYLESKRAAKAREAKKSASQSYIPPMTRKECRDSYPPNSYAGQDRNAKMRIECFRKATDNQ